MKLHKVLFGLLTFAIAINFSGCDFETTESAVNNDDTEQTTKPTTPTIDTTTIPDVPSGEYMASVGMENAVLVVDKNAGKLTYLWYVDYDCYLRHGTGDDAAAAAAEGEDIFEYVTSKTYENGAYKLTLQDGNYKIFTNGGKVYISKELNSGSSSQTNLILITAEKKALRALPAVGTYVSSETVSIEEETVYLYAVVSEGIASGSQRIVIYKDATNTVTNFESLTPYYSTDSSTYYDFGPSQVIYDADNWVFLSNTQRFKIKQTGVFESVSMTLRS